MRIKNADQPGKLVDATTPLLETTAKNAVVKYLLSDHSYATTQEILVFDKANFLTNADNQLEYLPQP